MSQEGYDAECFRAEFNVSRETMHRFEIYQDLLAKWNQRINLVSKLSLRDAWQRHFADSAQLWPLRSVGAHSWVDLGAGAGFPGLVIALLASEIASDLRVTLVESDGRKATFLRTVAQAATVVVTVIESRIESATVPPADILSARALAPLDVLLGYAEKHRRPEGICLFPKGEMVHREIAEAEQHWRFDYRVHQSRTETKAAIVEIGAIAHA